MKSSPIARTTKAISPKLKKIHSHGSAGHIVRTQESAKRKRIGDTLAASEAELRALRHDLMEEDIERVIQRAD
jgi:hypothetical protein